MSARVAASGLLRGVRETDSNPFLSLLGVRRKKAVSGDVFGVGVGSRAHLNYQKCDAKRPCTACVNGGRGIECGYEPRQPPRPRGTNVDSVPRDDTSSPLLGARDLPARTSADGFSFHETPISPSSDLPVSARSGSKESGSSLSPTLAPCERRPSKPAPRHPRELSPPSNNGTASRPSSGALVVYDTAECVSSPVGSSFTIIPSIYFRTIPRPLVIPLPLVPPELVQVSCVSRSDLDMT